MKRLLSVIGLSLSLPVSAELLNEYDQQTLNYATWLADAKVCREYRIYDSRTNRLVDDIDKPDEIYKTDFWNLEMQAKTALIGRDKEGTESYCRVALIMLEDYTGYQFPYIN